MFATFTPAQLLELVAMTTRRSAPRGSAIMHEGDPTDSLYIVISGRLKVMMGEADGKETILSIIGPGEFFGEMSIFNAERIAGSASAEAVLHATTSNLMP